MAAAAAPAPATPAAATKRKSKPEDVPDATSLDFSDCFGALDEDLLFRVLRFAILKPDGRFHDGVVFDGLDNSFLEYVIGAHHSGLRMLFAACSRWLVSSATCSTPCRWFAKATCMSWFSIWLLKCGNARFAKLTSVLKEALARWLKIQAECEAVLAEDVPAAFKRFKLLTDKEAERLAGEKLTRYNELLAIHTRRIRAEQLLAKAKTADLARLRAYFGDAMVDRLLQIQGRRDC